MKRFKRLIVLFIVMSLMLTTVACGNKDEDATTNKDGAQTEENKEDKSDKDKDDKDKEGGGESRKLHLLGHDKTGDIKFADREEFPVWQEVEKLLDAADLELEYEIVPFEQYEVVSQTRMAAANDLPDIVNLSLLDDTTVLNLAKQNVILELNELVDEYSNGNIKKMYNEDFPFAKQLTTSPDDSMYWFSNLHNKLYKGTEPAPVAQTMIIRKDWLEDLDIPVPTTADEYYETLKKMRDEDANGNGQNDEILIYDPSGFGSIAQWFGLGTQITTVDVENKEVVSPWYQEGVKDYFEYVQKLIEEELIDTSLIGAGNEEVQQKLIENKASSIEQYNLSVHEESVVEGGAEYLPLMPLDAVDGIEPAAKIEPPFLVWKKFSITKDCENLEAAIDFFDVIYSEEYADLLYWGIEGETYEVDENGVKTYKDVESSFDTKLASEGKAVGNAIFGETVFPRVQFANLEYEFEVVPDYKKEHELEVMNYKPYYPNMSQNYLAIPNDEQLEEKTRILNDLSTYSSELATKLALGQKSLDDWDDYMAELKELGLDKLIEIDQALLDRYFELGE